METHHARALALQKEVSKLTQLLADEIGRPASGRDAEAIRTVWAQISRYRSRLSHVHRCLRKVPRYQRDALPRAEYEAQRVRLNDAKMLGKRLMIWEMMARLVERHVEPLPVPLELNQPENDSDPMLGLFHMALFRLANPNKQSSDALDHGCFADIPMNIKPFEFLMQAAYRLLLVQGRADTARFLDVGCGGGTKVLAASLYFPASHGLDYDADYVTAGQKMLRYANAETCEIFQADGLTYDGYGNYDVIYFYRPLRDDQMLAKMERQIFDTARPGTIILAPYTGSLSPRTGNTRPYVKECIFVAGLDQSEVDVMHADAERTSPTRVRRPRDLRFDTGFWTPVLNAASQNGVVP